MHQRLLLAAALVAGLSSHALAQSQGQGQRVMLVDERGNPINATNVLPTSAGGGGGGGGTVTQGTTPWVVSGNGTANSGSNPFFVQVTNPSSPGTVTAAGTNGTQAQAVQGITGGVPVSVTGTFYQATQPVSAASWPLPTGAAQDSTITARLGTLGQKAAAGSTPVVIASDQASLPVTVGNFPSSQAVTNTGTFAVQNTSTIIGGNTTAVKTDSSATTQPVSAASLPLPVGAATSAKQPALGTAGTPSTDVITVQGATNGTPQPITLRAAGTNRSATVTTTASTLMAANTSRQGWKIKNDCTVAVVINFDTTATNAPGGGNILVAPGAYLASEPGFIETGAMSAIAASGSCALTAREH